MTVFIIRRVISLLLTLVGGFTLLFLLFFALPGDTARIIAGGNGKNPPPSAIENARLKYHLDESLPKQYVRRLYETATLSGESFKGEKVADVVAERLPNSLRLAVWAMAIEATVGMTFGVIAARRRNSVSDWVTTIGAAVMSSIPVFVLALLMKQVTGVYAFQHDWPSWAHLPTQSNANLGWYLGIFPSAEQFKHLIQPAIVLASVSTAIVARLTRTTVIEASTSEHVRTARAKGLSEKKVLRRHVLRNALIPIITYIGVDFGTLVGFAVLTETVFNWPGIGSKVAVAAQNHDLPIVLTLSVVVMAVYGLMNLIVDISYAKLDPRIRLDGAK